MFDVRKMQEQGIFNAVNEVADKDVAHSIVYGNATQFSAEDNRTWVVHTMHRLENHFDRHTIKQIRMNCQCGYAMDEKLAFVKELLSSSTSLEEFASSERARASGLSFASGELYLQFPFCPCPMLAEVDSLETDTWCQCTTGYSKVLFEKAFGCEVDVELLKSVKMGDDTCLMKITPRDMIWK